MNNKPLITDWIQVITGVITILITFWIGLIANSIAKEQNRIASYQADLMDTQTSILDTQTKILAKQTDIENKSLEFEKHKFGSEVAQNNEDKMNNLFDKIMLSDPTLSAIHVKVRNGDEVQNINNLDKYVSEFEEIGAQYCNGSIQKSDLIRILKNQIKFVCGNRQIFYHYQNTKSGLSGMCESLFPGTQMMAKYANADKCPILKK